MSQINQYIKVADNLEQKVNDLVSKIDNCHSLQFDHLADLEKFHEHVLALKLEVETLQEQTGNKISEKLNYVDPVTGERRYGLQTQQKFLVAHEKVELLIATLHNSFHKWTMYHQVKKSEFESQILATRHAGETHHEGKERIDEEEMARKEAAERERLRKKEEEDYLLHQQAELIRKRKLEDAQIIDSVKQQIYSTLDGKVNKFNNSCANIADIPKFFDMIRKYCQEHRQHFPLRTVTGTLVNILERIISKPDDANARKLRVNHPVLQTKLTAVPGAIQILIASGFHLQLRLPGASSSSSSSAGNTTTAPQPSPEDEDQSIPITLDNKERYEIALDHLQNLTEEDNLFPRFTDLLFPHSSWELFLEMEEPPIDDLMAPAVKSIDSVTTKKSWIEWYDSLKEALEKIKQEI